MEEEVHFKPVGSDGVFVARAENWQRVGNTVHGRVAKLVVVTCSGEVVPPGSLKAVCSTCRGYDAVLVRCAVCLKTLCHLHACRFEMPDGTNAVLCEEHRKKADRDYDTWAAQDWAQKQEGRTEK
jgi:hypothetical protein